MKGFIIFSNFHMYLIKYEEMLFCNYLGILDNYMYLQNGKTKEKVLLPEKKIIVR